MTGDLSGNSWSLCSLRRRSCLFACICMTMVHHQACTNISTDKNASYLLEDIQFCDKKEIRKAHVTWGSKPVRKCVIFSCSKVYPSVQPSTAVLLDLRGWIGHLINTSETPHVHTKTSQVQTKHQRWNNCLPRRIFRTSPAENPFILKNTGKNLPLKTGGGEAFGLLVWKLKQLQDSISWTFLSHLFAQL